MAAPRISPFAIVLAIAAAIVASIYVAKAFLLGEVVRWSDAYTALEARETTARAMSERVRLANAAVESEAPPGIDMGPRMHSGPMLARLRYERLDEGGARIGIEEVRALVPALPYYGSDAPGSAFGRVECPRACRAELARRHAWLLPRSGEPGLADEWVMRMPVGRTFDLGRRSLRLRDFAAAAPLSIPYSGLRVTLVEMCPATVRAGAVTQLDFFENAIVPIPRALRTRRWVQLEGCPEWGAREPAAR